MSKLKGFGLFLEDRLKMGKSFEEAVDTYNATPHCSLKYIYVMVGSKNYRRRQTPDERYSSKSIWDDSKIPEWRINGEVREFRIGK